MPLFEYRCTSLSCQLLSQELVLAGEAPEEIKCAHCGAPAKKTISSVVHRFYGPGFYKPNVRKRGEGIGTKRATEE